MGLRAFIAAVCLTGIPVSAAADTFLLMAEEHGCVWCERWNEEIADIYPKTSEGRIAPLRRYDIHDGTPEDVRLASAIRFTPTFVLLRDGAEIDRIEGYPGEDFFWVLLEMMLKRSNLYAEEAG